MLLQASAHSTVNIGAHNVHRPVPASKGTGFWSLTLRLVYIRVYMYSKLSDSKRQQVVLFI